MLPAVGESEARSTLGAALDPRHNSFNALRLLLALLVIVSHAPPAGGFGEPPMVGDVELGGWAVAGFFAISGWLITASRLRLGVAAYLWRRCLRIFPAFWASLVVTAAVIAPVTTMLTGATFDPGSAWGFVWRNLTLHIVQPTIEGSLEGLAYDERWNLSLWTLQWEFLCYVAICALLSVGFVRGHRWVLLVVLALLVIPYGCAALLGVEVTAGFAQGSRLGSAFVAGSVMYVYRDRIPLSGRLAASAVVALAILASLGLIRGWGAIPLAYVVLWLAASPRFENVGRRNDVSYGVYVYAFPVQLLLAAAGAASLGLTVYTVACCVAVLPLAWLSWLVIEKPSLKMKNLVPDGRPGEGEAVHR